MYDKELVAHKLLRWEKAVSGFKLPSWENIPDIGLYMDQVIVLLSQYLGLITSAGDKEEDERAGRRKDPEGGAGGVCDPGIPGKRIIYTGIG